MSNGLALLSLSHVLGAWLGVLVGYLAQYLPKLLALHYLHYAMEKKN